MKKTSLLLSAVTALFLTSATPVVAQSPSPTPAATPTIRQQINTAIENRQQVRQEIRDARAERIAERVQKRFSLHDARITNWLTRAEQRIAKMKENGKDTTTAEAGVVAARTSFANAQQLGATAIAKLQAIQAQPWDDQKDDVKAAKEAVRQAQVAYAQVVKDMAKVVQALKATAK